MYRTHAFIKFRNCKLIMIAIGDYNKIMSDRNIFNQIVYTPLSEALRLLDERQKDPKLLVKVEKLLKGEIPFFLKKNKCGVLGRQIATPNHETKMFIKITKENNLFPVFFEYYDDKFTSNNNYKHSLGQLQLQTKGFDKYGDYRFEKITIIDFNKYNGKKLRDTKTLWGEFLIDFHKRLFSEQDFALKDLYFYDGSEWFKKHGGQKAISFYTNFLSLFLCHGILFENFLTSKDEDGEFTKNIFLPALEKVINLTGVKPLIIPIGPLDIENDNFWFHHLLKIKKIIPKY